MINKVTDPCEIEIGLVIPVINRRQNYNPSQIHTEPTC